MAFAVIGGRHYSSAGLDGLRARLAARAVWIQCLNDFAASPLTYQTCRFCRAGDYGSKGGGLYKYGIRHYICEECLSDADPTLIQSIGRRAFLPEK